MFVHFHKHVAHGDGVRHPLDESTLLIQGDNTVCADVYDSCEWPRGVSQGEKLTEFSSTRFRVGLQQFVYNTIEVHQPGVLPQIVFRFSEEDIRLAVTASYADFPWLRQGAHYLDFVVENCQKLGTESGKIRVQLTNIRRWERLSGKADGSFRMRK